MNRVYYNCIFFISLIFFFSLMASHVDSYLLLAPAWSNSFIWPRVYNFSLLAPAWGSSFFVVSRVDSFFSSSCREQLFYVAHYELARSCQSQSGQSPMREEPRCCCRLSQQEYFSRFSIVFS